MATHPIRWSGWTAHVTSTGGNFDHQWRLLLTPAFYEWAFPEWSERPRCGCQQSSCNWVPRNWQFFGQGSWQPDQSIFLTEPLLQKISKMHSISTWGSWDNMGKLIRSIMGLLHAAFHVWTTAKAGITVLNLLAFFTLVCWEMVLVLHRHLHFVRKKQAEERCWRLEELLLFQSMACFWDLTPKGFQKVTKLRDANERQLHLTPNFTIAGSPGQAQRRVAEQQREAVKRTDRAPDKVGAVGRSDQSTIKHPEKAWEIWQVWMICPPKATPSRESMSSSCSTWMLARLARDFFLWSL